MSDFYEHNWLESAGGRARRGGDGLGLVEVLFLAFVITVAAVALLWAFLSNKDFGQSPETSSRDVIKSLAVSVDAAKAPICQNKIYYNIQWKWKI